jgi:hypothetical protein
MGSQVAIASASAYIAFILGAFLTILRGDPFIAATVAWALRAVACQTVSASASDTLKLPDVTKESLYKTENALAVLLLFVGAFAPIVGREFQRFEL